MSERLKDDLQIERRLDKWAKSSVSDDTRGLTNNLAAIYRAATRVVEAIEVLITDATNAQDQERRFTISTPGFIRNFNRTPNV
jgi:hypothetical protein